MASVQTELARLFETGERLRLTEAPFVGIEGVYQMTDGERRVMVLIEKLSRPIVVWVIPANLHKVSLRYLLPNRQRTKKRSQIMTV